MFFKIFLTLISCLAITSCYPNAENNEQKDFVYYFGYGSNMLAKRMHINNPSAVFVGSAKLPNYRLDFMYTGITEQGWNGAAATIVEDDASVVWGTIWKLDVDQIGKLDAQESIYYSYKNVTVIKPDGTEVVARTYIGLSTPDKLGEGEDLPERRRPSNTYLEVMALGAIESHLPPEHIGLIFSFPSNGRKASDKMRHELGYPF